LVPIDSHDCNKCMHMRRCKAALTQPGTRSPFTLALLHTQSFRSGACLCSWSVATRTGCFCVGLALTCETWNVIHGTCYLEGYGVQVCSGDPQFSRAATKTSDHLSLQLPHRVKWNDSTNCVIEAGQSICVRAEVQ